VQHILTNQWDNYQLTKRKNVYFEFYYLLFSQILSISRSSPNTDYTQLPLMQYIHNSAKVEADCRSGSKHDVHWYIGRG